MLSQEEKDKFLKLFPSLNENEKNELLNHLQKLQIAEKGFDELSPEDKAKETKIYKASVTASHKKASNEIRAVVEQYELKKDEKVLQNLGNQLQNI